MPSSSYTIRLVALALGALGAAAARSAAMRQVIDLSGPDWTMWLDREASWEDDDLHLPPVDVTKLPAFPPTGGWDVLMQSGRQVTVPGTVEEYCWDEEGGDYKGVSWWRNEFLVPAEAAGKRAMLQFDAVRLRAEVFLNRRLVGYDVVGNTPFAVDVTDHIRPGEKNELAVRITDPSGNFDWMDFLAHRWGHYTIPASHGFGGVTDKVRLLLLDPVSVDDVFVMNEPGVTDIEVRVTVRNTTTDAARLPLRILVESCDTDESVVFDQTWADMSFPPGECAVSRRLSVPGARPWELDSPRLYRCRVSLGDADETETRFGFRWFDVDGVGTDAVFRLNGRRIVLQSAISWGFWPISGIVPTKSLALREVRAARRLGLNMLNFHRCIGRPLLFDLSDELGLLRFEEPGGYTARGGDDFCRAWAREKLLRMVRRDRNHPSLVIYNMINEENEIAPSARHKQDMADAHRLDPTRIITYTSGWSKEGDDPFKLHMRPYDDAQYTEGWFDYHNAPGQGSYRDEFYSGPSTFLRHTDNRQEIVFWGEEGANASPPRLQGIVAEMDGGPNGWDGADYREWLEAYEEYLTAKGLTEYFPSIDDLHVSMGNVQYYYQGRIIENIRSGNVSDGYVINGWEAEKIENHSGIVDCYRHFKGDPDLLARYNAPLYVAVKLRTKVAQAPADVIADFHLVNEVGLAGPKKLHVELRDQRGKTWWTDDFSVQAAGGETFGQLLVENVSVRADCPAGRYTLRAQLLPPDGDPQDVEATGDDELFLVDWKSSGVPSGGAVLDESGVVSAFLAESKGTTVPKLSPDLGPRAYVVVGEMDLEQREAIPTDCLIPADGEGTGLTGEYYKGADFHRRIMVRNDKTVDFDFSDKGPARAVGAEEYSIRWRGRLRAPESGQYTVYTVSDDGIRLWIDRERVIDHWSSHGAVLDAAPPIELEAGREYEIRLEFFQRGGGAEIRLLWTRPDMTARIDTLTDDLVRRVRDDGTTVLVLAHADEWAKMFGRQGVLDYKGRMNHGKWWLGGSFFVRPHPLFDGLPTGQAFNWEYQEFLDYDALRYGLLLDGEEAVVAGVSDHQHVVSTAVGVLRYGKGRIVLSTLDILRSLNGPPGPADVVRKVFCNYLAYAAEADDAGARTDGG